LAAALAVSLVAAPAGAQERTANEQIRDAVVAAPQPLRSGATVLGYGGEPRAGDVLTVLRVGSNQLICLADDPSEPGFHTACYQRSLDEYMALGRRLRAEGKARSEVMDARHAALEAGELRMPARAALYSVSADAFPEPDGALVGERRLAVVYLPGATGEELGLPTRPSDGGPWLMLPGTPWAHIMISR
jgi:hypothetical protein